MITLEQDVRDWVKNRVEPEYDYTMKAVLEDIQHGGCQSGMVSHLIYHVDTGQYYQDHKEEISEMVYELLDSTGCSIRELFWQWDEHDPFVLDTNNQNLLAWFGFEEMAKRMLDELENQEVESWEELNPDEMMYNWEVDND